MADLSDDIETAATKPKSATIDGNTVTAHTLAELIEADQYLKTLDAVDSAKRGLVFQRFKPPGTA